MNAMRTLIAVLLAGLLLAGCVERRMSVVTEPAGAKVYVDGDEVGTSPVSVPFTHYGTREVHVIYPNEAQEGNAPGYQSQRRHVDLRPPFYEIMPFDLIAEALYPGTLVDDHPVVFRLREVDTDQAALVERARYYRAMTRAIEAEPTPAEGE